MQKKKLNKKHSKKRLELAKNKRKIDVTFENISRYIPYYSKKKIF